MGGMVTESPLTSLSSGLEASDPILWAHGGRLSSGFPLGEIPD